MTSRRNLIWVEREIRADAVAAWNLLTDVDRWPDWGPSIRAAELDGDRFEEGASGSVITTVGVRLPFEITDVDDGRRWAWRVAGLAATDHRVRRRGPGACVVGFGVPRIAAPYTIICRRALTTIDRLLT